MKKYLIIGGVAGGASTAARLRRSDESARIILIERGKFISYANCGLPYYLGGIIKERDKLFVQTAKEFGRRFNIDIRTRNEVVRLDSRAKIVTVINLDTGVEYEETYDKLVLSPGAKPQKPPLPGNDLSGVFNLRNVEDTDQIKEFLLQNKPEKAIVVGAGYIGIEMVENLRHLCSDVSLVEMTDRILPFFDYEMSSALSQHIQSKGVRIFLKEKVTMLEQRGARLMVSLASGRKLETDMLIFATGIRPDTDWLKDSGLGLSENGSILVDDYLMTNDQHIYALGDAIQTKHQILDNNVNAYLAGPASKQGRIVADNIVFGNNKKYKGIIGTAIIKVFDLTAAMTGATEHQLQRSKKDFLTTVIHTASYAGYYPDAQPISIKLLFSPDKGEILGVQIIGFMGVDKRVDVISAFIQKGGKVSDLTEFEHSYAPPYSSARDPISIAGFVAENMIKRKFKAVNWSELEDDKYRQALLLDVRTPEEFAWGSIPGSINIPLDDLRDRFSELPPNRDIVVYCLAGHRGYLACRLLSQKGFDKVYNLAGGYKTYQFAYGKDDKCEDIYEGETILQDDSIFPEDEAFKS